MQWLSRATAIVLGGALFVAACIAGMAPRVWAILNAHEQVPVVLPTFSGLAERTLVFDSEGVQIGAFQLENSQPLDVDQVPVDVIAAILAVEDAGFYNHEGVNIRALVRATLSNFQAGSARQGASTITQQVVKNEYLSGLARDGRYKILQARYAVMLEKQVPKKVILERYLNTVYFGNNAYGLQAAAEVYFGVPVEQLNLVQGAFLAGLIQAPTSYDPIRRPERSRERFRIVLDRLVNVDLITEPRAKYLGVKWEIPEILKSVPQRSVERTYFTEAVKDYLLNQSTVLGDTYQERYNALFRGGLRIHTTLNAAMQGAAEEAAKALPANQQGFEAAMLSLDSATGGVRAMVGGAGFVAGQNEVNMTLRRRQTGSSIKFFILTAALEAGVQANDIIDGTLPCVLPNPGKPSEPFEITQGVSAGIDQVDVMTAKSINCAYARLSQIVGLNRVVTEIYKMASSQYLTPDTYKIQPYASLATGANEMSPLDMASGAQTLANNGLHMQPYMVESIEGPEGTFYTHEAKGVQVVPAEIAHQAVDIMKGTLQYGTARNYPLAGGRPAAGKTGTQDENTNAWFVGFTPQLTTSVWVGDPDAYTPMVNVPEFLKDGIDAVIGGTYPAKIWKAFMDRSLSGYPLLDWNAPLPPLRGSMRLYLPGTECIAKVVNGSLPSYLTGPVETVPGQTAVPIDTTTTASTTDPSTSTTSPPNYGRRTVVSIVPSDTTVPDSETNPNAPVPMVDPRAYLVYDCAKPIPSGIGTTVGR